MEMWEWTGFDGVAGRSSRDKKLSDIFFLFVCVCVCVCVRACTEILIHVIYTICIIELYLMISNFCGIYPVCIRMPNIWLF